MADILAEIIWTSMGAPEGTHMPEGHLGPAEKKETLPLILAYIAIILAKIATCYSRTRAHAHTRTRIKDRDL